MKHVLGLLVGAGVLFSATVVWAGEHQICYQGQNEGSRKTVVVHCRSDVPSNTCQISVPGGTLVNAPNGAGGTVQRFAFAPSPVITTVAATVTFSNGVTRACTTTLSADGNAKSSRRAPTALTSFGTDGSGLVMTGVWQDAPTAAQNASGGAVFTPGDFIAVGGGVVDATGQDAVVSSGDPVGGDPAHRSWVVSMRGNTPRSNNGYAIGLKIEGADVRALHRWDTASSPDAAQGSASVAVPSGRSGIGAAVFVSTQVGGLTAAGQYLLQSSPTTRQISCRTQVVSGKVIKGRTPGAPTLTCDDRFALAAWQGSASDLGTNSPGHATVQLLSLPTEITIGNKTFEPIGDIFSASSASGNAPSVTVTGPEGYALTGVGVALTPGPNTTFTFSKLLPRAEIRGAEVAGRAAPNNANFAITAYAVGLRLVEKVAPPPVKLVVPGLPQIAPRLP